MINLTNSFYYCHVFNTTKVGKNHVNTLAFFTRLQLLHEDKYLTMNIDSHFHFIIICGESRKCILMNIIKISRIRIFSCIHVMASSSSLLSISSSCFQSIVVFAIATHILTFFFTRPCSSS